MCSATARAAILATFEGYPEGSLGSSFTESHSGIIFTNATYSGGPTAFIAEYGDPPFDLSPIFPGTILTTALAAPGPSVGLGGLAGFSATFPVPSTTVEMDVVFGSRNILGLTITGYSNANEDVAETTYSLSGTGLTYKHVVFTAPVPLKRIVVVPSGLAAYGFDNISILPEPGAATLAIAASIFFARRRNTAL